jgi:hypothetical protein
MTEIYGTVALQIPFPCSLSSSSQVTKTSARKAQAHMFVLDAIGFEGADDRILVEFRCLMMICIGSPE